MFGWKKLTNMKPQEKATELIEKFGCNAIERVDYTLDIWKMKRGFDLDSLNKGNRSEKILRGLKICDRTLIYWNKVKIIINNELRDNKRPI